MDQHIPTTAAVDDERLVTTPGLKTGDFVPLTVDEFARAHGIFVDGVEGILPPDPDFPKAILDAKTGKPMPIKDTPFLRGWIAAGKAFDDDARRISFYQRLERVFPLIGEREYSQFFQREPLDVHITLMAAVARVRFNLRTKPKSLRRAFDSEFRNQLATFVAREGHETRH